MRPDVVEVLTPGFDHDAGLLAAPEPFQGQALVTELPVEALIGPVLPGFARVDERGVDAFLGELVEDRMADEFRAVVRAQVARRTMLGHEAREHFDHTGRADRAGDVDRECLAGELIDHGQALDLLAVGAGVEHEVVGPDVVGPCRRQGPRP